VASVTFVGLKEFDKDQLIKGLKEIGVAVSRTFDRANSQPSFPRPIEPAKIASPTMATCGALPGQLPTR
jgi:hypothetical protein